MSGHLPKPEWLRRPVGTGPKVHALKSVLRKHGLHTVCESARCPNIEECFSQPTATFLIMGDACTRDCSFCAIGHGKPQPLNAAEPENLARVAADMGLAHVVVTSVTRDDLPDYGAAHFRAVCDAIWAACPESTIEVLVPDFMGSTDSIKRVVDGPIDVFNHNLETVPRLYPAVRPSADYKRSLGVLKSAKDLLPGLTTKSGLMVGLGEEAGEIERAMDDLLAVGCDVLTIGQYLRPRLANHPVDRYWEPGEFAELEKTALAKGFKEASCAPLVRSSYHAHPLKKK